MLEASFSGKPIIAPIATGQKDFLDSEYTIELPHSFTKVPQSAFPNGYVDEEAKWATSKLWSVIEHNERCLQKL